MIVDFYDLEGYHSETELFWFVSEDYELHHFFGPPDADGYFDGETHFSASGLKVKDVVFEAETPEYFLISFQNDSDIYRIKTAQRIWGKIDFHHWRHGKKTYYGI